MRTFESKHRSWLPALALALLVGATAAVAADPAPAQSDFKSMLGDLWARLRAAGTSSQPANANRTVTAGIRGEATESQLKPYWKGDRDQDPAYQAERKELASAQQLADSGKYADSAKAYDAFAQAHPQSPLTADARFGAALSRAALGDKPHAKAGFESFLKDNPQHPLAPDAKRALAALK